MKTFLVAVSLFLPVISSATEISIGGVRLQIPSPFEFGPVTQAMLPLYELERKFVPPTNEEFVSFIPERDLPAALDGDIPNLQRRFSVQTSNSLANVSVSSSDFAKLKEIIKAKNDELAKKVEMDLPGLMKQISKGIAETQDMNLELSATHIMPLPVHEETDRTLAYSAFVKFNLGDTNGDSAPSVAVFTATFAHVKGKVIFLYSYAGEAGLEWSRDASKQWAEAVVAANPSDLRSLVRESLPSAVSAIDWRRVGAKAAVGGIVALILGLIGWAVNRGKSG